MQKVKMGADSGSNAVHKIDVVNNEAEENSKYLLIFGKIRNIERL